MSSDEADSAGQDSSTDNPHTWRIERPFGSGLKRKQIQFVPASDDKNAADVVQETVRDTNRGSSVADFYLSLVLPSDSKTTSPLRPTDLSLPNQGAERKVCGSTDAMKGGTTNESMMPFQRDPPSDNLSAQDVKSKPQSSPCSLDTSREAGTGNPAAGSSEEAGVQHGETVVERPLITTSSAAVDQICPTCNTRVTDWNLHVRTTVHMASREHSKTPHHLNRRSEGYKHMVKLGWDPDSSKGLGAEGQGIRFPVKATTKKDYLGIGAKTAKSIRDDAEGNVSESDAKKPRLLSSKEMRRLEQSERAARQDLHDYLRH
ncbi:hypothetical protein ABW19_dt0210073 [Dactylella cylindrospora]|nr:hypothetical protein ABW19_dt0210073 [Dactylella cylindrospora]